MIDQAFIESRDVAVDESDPLALVRELAYAHAEKLRDGADTAVIALDEHREEQA